MKQRIFYAQNIDWDTDGDAQIKNELPKNLRIVVTSEDVSDLNDMFEIDEYISDYISDEIGYCHYGYNLKEVA